MTFYEYIIRFKGMDGPFGDLADDIETEIRTGGNMRPNDVRGIYESDFSDIYEHLKHCGACAACLDTFVESWAAYRRQERTVLKDPAAFLIADQLKRLNESLSGIRDELKSQGEALTGIYEAMYTSDGDTAADMIENLADHFDDVIETRRTTRGEEYTVIRIGGEVDTYEQN